MKSIRCLSHWRIMLLLFGVCVFGGITPCFAQISITPSIVEVKLDKGRSSGEFYIANIGQKEERYRIQASFFNFSRTGGLLRPEADAHSMSDWIIFNPKEFTLAPKTKRVIRYSITPRGTLRPGEYWIGMELESLNTTMTTGHNNKGETFNIGIIPTILVPIFGQVGEIKYDGTFGDAALKQTPEGIVLDSCLTNTGTGRLRPIASYEILNSDGASVEKGALGVAFVLAQNERLFQAPIKTALPEGTYTIRVSCAIPQLPVPITRETVINWKPTPLTQTTPPAPPNATGPAENK